MLLNCYQKSRFLLNYFKDTEKNGELLEIYEEYFRKKDEEKTKKSYIHSLINFIRFKK